MSDAVNINKMINRAEAMAILGVKSRSSFYRLRGHISFPKPVKYNDKTVLYSMKEIIEFRESKRAE